MLVAEADSDEDESDQTFISSQLNSYYKSFSSIYQCKISNSSIQLANSVLKLTNTFASLAFNVVNLLNPKEQTLHAQVSLRLEYFVVFG